MSISNSRKLTQRLLLVALAPVILSTASCGGAVSAVQDVFDSINDSLSVPIISDLEDVTLAIGEEAPSTFFFRNTGGGIVNQCTVDPALPAGLMLAVATVGTSSVVNACRVSGTVGSTATVAEVEYTVTVRTEASSSSVTTNRDTATVTINITAAASGATQLFNNAKGVLNTGSQSVITDRDGSSHTVSQ